jgi:putative phage-type endonuclease
MPKDNNNRLPDKLGTASLIGVFENQSPEWHALRATGIGGSDVGTITRCNPWQSPFALWAKKTGRISDDISGSEAAEWGTRLESVVLDKFAEEHPELIIHREVGTWKHNEREWQLANPDAIAFNPEKQEWSIIEIKTSRYEDDWSEGVPAYYRTQVQWYMQTFGIKSAFVATLFAGSKYREFELEASEFEQDTNLAEVEKFRKFLDSDTQPDYDGALSTYQTIRELHPDIDPEGTVELGDLYVHFSNAQAEFQKAELHFNEMRSRVLDALGTAKRGTYEDKWVVSRQSKGPNGTPYLVQKRG